MRSIRLIKEAGPGGGRRYAVILAAAVAALSLVSGTAAAGQAAGRAKPANVAGAPAVLTGHLRSGAPSAGRSKAAGWISPGVSRSTATTTCG